MGGAVRKIVIIGGVAGGAGAAAKARRVDERAQITMFERGPYVSFANCGLPYYIGGEIAQREALFVQTPEGFAKRFRVIVRVRHEVTRIDRAAKRVEVRDLATGAVSTESYDALILSPGAGAIIPPIPGIEASNIFTVKTVPDADAIKAFLEQARPQRAVVIGAGFIGLEAAEALARRGLDVTVVELQPQVLPPFDADIAAFVQQQLESAGLHVVLSDGVKAFHLGGNGAGGARATEVELQSGRRLPMDLAILSIGVRPELKLAKDAGLTIGRAGGIEVNERQQTSDPSIYAAGDAVEVLQVVTGQPARIPLAGPANKQGRVAGANAAGEALTFAGALGTAIVETMGITAAKTGLSEREAKQAGIPAYVSLTHSADHATYYPGSALLHMKLVVGQRDGRLLGAQIVGERGVDKRVDVLATAISARLTVSDLEQLDLAYAPQFSSAKDPVVVAGFVAANVLRGELETITCDALQERMRRQPGSVQIVDVRAPTEQAEGHLPGAALIPVDALRERLNELDPSRETVVYCRVGLRGYLAARILQQHGFARVRNLTGGLLMCPKPPQAAASTEDRHRSVSVQALQQALAEPEAVVIDVREPDEHQYESIPKTKNVPLSRLTREPRAIAPGARPVYLVCQSGLRAQQAEALLRRAGCSDVRVVTGGLDAWRAAGLPLRRSGAPLPIMRQVQIVAGSLALVGALMPGLRWVAIAVGAGLVFAGISGWCGMAMLLAKLPFNRAPRVPPPGAANGSCASPTASCGRP